MANENDVATLAESLSEIREAIERVATAIKLKDSTVVVVNNNELASSTASATQELVPEKQQSSKPHLHHDHETGKIYGFTHPVCNPYAERKMIIRLRKEIRELRGQSVLAKAA